MATIANNQNRDWFFWLVFIAAGISIVLLSSCSCQFYQRKLDKKCPKVQDTIIVHDTLITSNVTTDTIFKYFQRDTVIVREGKLTMKYFYNSHDSTVYLNGRCAPDTIIREIRVPYEQNRVEVDYWPGWAKWVVITLLLLLVIGFLSRKLFG